MKRKYIIANAVSLALFVIALLIILYPIRSNQLDNMGVYLLAALLVCIIPLASLIKIEEKYYSDGKNWLPEKIQLPNLNKDSFVCFFKECLIENNFVEFFECEKNKELEDVKIFYKKGRGKVYYVALIDADKVSSKHIQWVMQTTLSGIKSKVPIKSVFFRGTFLPIFYSDEKDTKIKNLLKKPTFEYLGDWVFPCVAVLNERTLYVTRLVITYVRGRYGFMAQRMQRNQKKAVTIINSILNIDCKKTLEK